MIVSRYGLHWAESVPFLLQETGASNLLSPNLECPFVPIVKPRRFPCPHNINIDEFVEPPTWIDDPLAKVFLPLPGEGCKLIYDPTDKLDGLLTDLQRLGSPVSTLIRPVWWNDGRKFAPNYKITNILPVVWARANPHHMRAIDNHLAMVSSSPRRMLIVARTRLPIFHNVEWIETGLTSVAGEPLEQIGAGALRQYMNDPPTSS